MHVLLWAHAREHAPTRKTLSPERATHAHWVSALRRTAGYSEYLYLKIPEGHCWVEGDRPEFSKDSNTYGEWVTN